ncbi:MULTISPECIES: V-type ATPase subunit [Halanaerobium]|uniref:V/A-type H+-transporting ATPase subunit C n=1 Tax=Halanaerobium kushneri TaxID=56779 RepID=A0A1N6XBE0_9FIRM|nr:MULTISPECIES: V-type ATPase subunit [Halanaerobium]RCW62049.1 V/A-type H+-transporting ATPase subunit C [Halanaerobium sp. ST460_2HS_T2]SIQ99674.1 V/A-type H+-transporting ATPase subunit C [Halanaerobium kushneri]
MPAFFQYPAVNAKLKALSSSMLKEKDFQKLIELNSVQEAFNYLYNNTYYQKHLEEFSGQEIHRRQLELNLKKSLVLSEDFLKKYVSSDLKSFIEHYFKKFEIEDLKIILRTILMDSEESYLTDNLIYIDRNKKIDFNNLIQASSYNEIKKVLKNLHYSEILDEFSDQYQKNKNLFPIEMTLDFYYFSELNKLAENFSSKDKKYFEEIIGTHIDLLNIQWVYRIKRYYNLSSGEILNYIIPYHFKVKRKELQNMSQENKSENLVKHIAYQPYQQLLEKAIKDENVIFERFFLNHIFKKLQQIKTESFFTISNILAYLYIREYELRDIITVLEGIRYSLPKDRIKNFLIRKEV